jgi:hypothetical protein
MKSIIFAIFVLASISVFADDDIKCGQVVSVRAVKGKHAGVLIHPHGSDDSMSFGGGFSYNTEARFLPIALAGISNPSLNVCINSDFMDKGITQMEIKL